MQLTHSQLMQAKPENVARLARFLGLPDVGEHDYLTFLIVRHNQQPQKPKANVRVSRAFLERESVGFR